MIEIKKISNFLIYLPILFFLLISLLLNFQIKGEQQFSFLAQSFLQGKLYFIEQPGSWLDTAYYNNHYYWPLAPFPALLLIPFVFLFNLFHLSFYQGYLQFFITLGVFFLCFKITRKFNYSQNDSLLLSFAFCFASIYQLIALVPWSWYFVQAITVLLLFLIFFEYLSKKRYWLIGILFGLIFMSRFTAGLGVIFFILEILFNKNYPSKHKIQSLAWLFIPIIFSGLLLLGYNYLRFNNVFNNGYTMSNNESKWERLNFGLFKLKNIPTNFYYYFIKTVDPVLLNYRSLLGQTYILKPPYIQVNFPGAGFFFISPIFLYILKIKLKEKNVRLALVPMAIILFSLLSYYWPGWRQVGPRYLLDLLPFAYLLLLYSFKEFKLPILAKIIIFFSASVNLYLLMTI